MAGNSSAKAVKVSKAKPNLGGIKFSGRGMSLGLLIILFPCLVLGILVGGFGFYTLTKNDCFEMVAPMGQTEVDIEIGGEGNPSTYIELGANCVSFGKNVTDTVKIKYLYREDITHDTTEVDAIDPNVSGYYYVIYTSSNFKYKTVQLIRNVTVFRVED